MVVRGAPETLLEHSTLPPAERRALRAWAKARGQAGERVLGIARIQMGKKGAKCDLPHGLEFLGIAAFADPVKKSAFEAVEKARELGIGLVILTGDSVEVAGAVAHQIGLITHPDEVLSGDGLFRLPPEAQKRALEAARVVARVSPEQKYAILKILKGSHEVGFLGEGINDAPALKIAGVSLVVDSASEIAREAADIILLQKDLRVIVEGVREGRAVFANTIKYIKATMASNFGNFYAVAIVSLFIDFLPMLPIQILLLNLLSDFPMIAIAADRVGRRELARPQRYDLKDIIVFCTMLGLVSTVFDFLFFASFVRLGEGALQTNWFMGSILTELALIFSIRSRRLFFRAQAPARILAWLSGLAALATIVLPFTALGRTIFHFMAPRPQDIILILSLVLVYFASTEGVKHLYYRYWVKV
jgi:Mg2+-importing ATPase